MGSPEEDPPRVELPEHPSGEPDSASPSAARPRRRSFRLAAAVVTVAVAIGGIGGYAITRNLQTGPASVSTSSATAVTTPTTGTSGSSATGATKTKLTLAQIEAAVDPALVDITATLGDSATAAGTGMVISSTGEILTNNHVIAGATAITVQIGGTGAKYAADVVGYDTANDVAVLQIAHVSGLTTVATASASTVSTSDAVVAIGNALGKSGTPTAVDGVVAALEQTITASDEYGTSAETLNGLIEFTADVQPGDSGGSLVNAYGQVVGMTTAASSGIRSMSTSSTTTAYAIPIDRALAIARQIAAGSESATVHIGEHGLLGVQVDATVGVGAAVLGVQTGSAAAQVGIAAGDIITAVAGQNVDSSTALSAALASTHVGDKIAISWQDAAGAAHTASVTLTTGAA
ncbi:MAG: septum formation initiator [Actinomycetia bacterium]|nr:septum formation initiator [Actinomycetes bacterium]